MQDKIYKRLITKRHLKLAFQRIRTGQNRDYKNYYRNIFNAYGLQENKNIQNLHNRLKAGVFKPSDVLRFYMPKDNGLHRPITLLHVEDMIVYQAIADLYASKFEKRRKPLEDEIVFSNILCRDKSKKIYLVEKWQKYFSNFIKRIKKFFNTGYRWVAHFDLAAYYDTIDYLVLCSQYSRVENRDFCRLVQKCLSTWSTYKTHESKKLFHGIPQGPIASNLLSEIYFFPIDKVMVKKNICYLRYVDDIRIFGKTKAEVQEGIIALEKECKERGLIPQSKKYVLKEAQNEDEAVGRFPSLTESQKIDFTGDSNKEFDTFKQAFDSDPMDISKVRYILLSSNGNPKILEVVINNLFNRHELVKEFCSFLIKYYNRKDIAQKIFDSVINKNMPYEYVEGKYWELLSYFDMESTLQSAATSLLFNRLKKSNKYALKYGVYKYLFSNNNNSQSAGMIRWLENESSALLQAMNSNAILPEFYDTVDFKNLIIKYTKRTNFEPMLALLKELFITSRYDLLAGIRIPRKMKNGVIGNMIGLNNQMESIQAILENRYNITNIFVKWKKFLGVEYKHANAILYQAETSYNSDRSAWLNYTDSFNDVVTKEFLRTIKIKLTTQQWPLLQNVRGKYIEYGCLLEKSNLMCKTFTGIFDGFRTAHDRRSKTPASHAYDLKTFDKTRPVSLKEQIDLSKLLSSSYDEFIKQLNLII